MPFPRSAPDGVDTGPAGSYACCTAISRTRQTGAAGRAGDLLTSVSRAIARDRELAPLFTTICRRAVRTGGVNAAAIGIMPRDGHRVWTIASAGSARARAAAGHRVFWESGLPAKAIARDTRVIRADARRSAGTAGWRDALPRGGALAAFPIRVDGAAIGAFVLASGTAGAFAPSAVRVLDEITQHLGFAAASHARARDGRRLNEIKEEERGRIARDLHDNLGQQLTALTFDVSEVKRRLRHFDLAGAVERLEEMAALVATSMADLRRVASDLRPPLLLEHGLIAALNAYVQDLQRHSGLPCRLIAGAPDLRMEWGQSIVCFRIVQEALTNIVRHARATCATVHLIWKGDVVMITVADDGVGITSGAMDNPAAIGLAGMADRARLAGGSLRIARRSAGGTAVVARIPIAQARA